jgi:SIR2-like domain
MLVMVTGSGSGEYSQYPKKTLDEETWAALIDNVINGECTPFLGAGISSPYVPTGKQLSMLLAKESEYPLDDKANLARVAQYITSLRKNPGAVKRRVCDIIRDAQLVAVGELSDKPPRNHLLLASLDLPIYITTNYDNYMEGALQAIGNLEPTVDICRWNDRLVDELPTYRQSEPSAKSPTIFHMHGHTSWRNSILVTEDDYIDFTVSLAQRDAKDPVIPHFVRRALGNSSLLFVGYSLEDWNFRVLMRHLMKQQKLLPHEQYGSLSIQLSDEDMPPERRARAEKFLEVYLSISRIDVHWGHAGPFLEELYARVAAAR